MKSKNTTMAEEPYIILLRFVVIVYIIQPAQSQINGNITNTLDDYPTTVPDEQRLYEYLMEGYEKSVRPVRNSSTVLVVKFALHLNQIIGLVLSNGGSSKVKVFFLTVQQRFSCIIMALSAVEFYTRNILYQARNSQLPNMNHYISPRYRASNVPLFEDERHQVLTTNVFIDQQWLDESLSWEPDDYNNIRSIRIPASNVWLPDTFIYNNADGGSTGFMKGTYVLVNYNGTVLWPVPVKLKSSCKVDITYFPFDDQLCFLRFGSWIYSSLWMDYDTMYQNRSIELSSYVNNSEWDLLSVMLKKNIRTHSCCDDPYPDLTYTLHVRRKTFYYIFNIIVPCIMLSILTLLTFWLPPTSGEKITLGLSVFLAFSMFMLLIAEEVPATSEAVPLIGIYLCVVMTLTSLSVIMAVMVINLYNRGAKTRRAPVWVRVLVLKWISFILRMRHDLERIVESINLESDAEIDTRRSSFRANRRQTSMRRTRETALSSIQEYTLSRHNTIRRRHSNNESNVDDDEATAATPLTADTDKDQENEVIWIRRDDVYPESLQPKTMKFEMEEHCSGNEIIQPSSSRMVNRQTEFRPRPRPKFKPQKATKPCILANEIKPKEGDTKSEIYYRKLIVAEWQRVAAVVDRVLFWLYFIGTIVSYMVILIIIPGENYDLWDAKIQQTPYVRSNSRYTM